MIARFVNFNALFRRTLPIVLVSAAVCSTASADVYRWVEADGTVNYGERAPKNAEYTVISRSAPTKAGSRILNKNGKNDTNGARQVTNARAASSQQQTETNLSDHQQEMLSEIQAAEAARVAAVDKLRKENCASSKRTLSNLQATGRIRVRDKSGEESAMTDEDRTQRINDAQKSIVINCDSLS